MHKNTLLEILRTFSNEDFEKLEDYVKSPFFNKNAHIIKFYSEIKKYAPAFNSEKLEKEKIWKVLFPQKKYNYGVMKNLIHELTKLTEGYISYSCFSADLKPDEYLIEGLFERNVPNLLSKKMKKYLKDIEGMKERGLSYFANKRFVLPYLNTASDELKLADDARVLTNEVIIKYFLLSYLPNSFHLVVEEQRTKVKHDHSFLKYVLGYFKDNVKLFSDSPELQVYYYLMLSYLDIQDDENYKYGHSIFKTNYDSIGDVDRANIFNIMRTLCILKNDNGKNEYRKNDLRLLIEMADKDCVAYKKTHPIRPALYRGIVSQACEMEEYDLLNKFMLKYRKSIEMNGEAYAIYANAMIAFSKKEFEKCIELCSKINFKDIYNAVQATYYYKNDVKILFAKALYELNMTENLLSSLDAHKHYLKNADYINEINKLPVVNFINYMNQLVKYKERKDVYGLQKFLKKVQDTHYMNSAKWFVRKINELID